MNITTPRILRVAAVAAMTGLSRATLYREISHGRFPRPVPLTGDVARNPEDADNTGRAVGWLSTEVIAWIEGRRQASRREDSR